MSCGASVNESERDGRTEQGGREKERKGEKRSHLHVSDFEDVGQMNSSA